MVTSESQLRAFGRGDARPSTALLAGLLAATGDAAQAICRTADAVRREAMGDEVFLRGIIEFSNHCRNDCAYCGIRRGSRGVQRYRMTPEELVEEAGRVRGQGCSTVVLQSGDDPWFTAPRLCAILEQIKGRHGLAVTLSVGVRPPAELHALHAAGCDRWLLRFETSDRAIFAAIHPDESFDRRLQCLRDLRDAGIQVGSGFMIGLPGGTLETIAADLLFATGLDLDMIGCGPFIAHPDTPLGGQPPLANREVYFTTIALLRLLNPRAHIPATTAFDALVPGGRDRLLQAGCNVFMPNLTPAKYRRLYQLYPGKPCVDEDAAACAACAQGRLARLGRPIGQGPGHSRRDGKA